VTWRVLTNAVASDLERLSDEDRDAVVQDLLGWVDDGPPRGHPREVGGARLFEERLPSGFEVVYVVVETVPLVALLRLRRTP